MTRRKELSPYMIERWMLLSSIAGPRIEQVHPDGLTYESRPGNQTWDVIRIRDAVRKMWGACGYVQPNKLAYIQYVQQRYNVDTICHLPLLEAALCPAFFVHGDCTCENFIDGKPIDYGHPRGMYCIENDIGKLLQCCTSFYSYRDGSVPTLGREELVHSASRASLSMMLTHFQRMIRHQNARGALYAVWFLGKAQDILRGCGWNGLAEFVLGMEEPSLADERTLGPVVAALSQRRSQDHTRYSED